MIFFTALAKVGFAAGAGAGLGAGLGAGVGAGLGAGVGTAPPGIIFYTSRRMKRYHMYFFFLKFLLIIQTVLILLQVQNPSQISYIASDILFKSSLGIFLMVFFTFSTIPTMDNYDKLIAVFAGTLLVFDSLYVSLPVLLTKLGYKLPKWIVVQREA